MNQALTFLTKRQVRWRGWTEKMIVEVLGEPDGMQPNPLITPGRIDLYRLDRVEAAEQADWWRELRQIYVVVMPPNTNRTLTIQAPPIQLRDLQLRAGTCHEAILTILTSDPDFAGQAVSADQLDRALAERGEHYARGTVYKTLRRMARKGLLRWNGSRFQLTDTGAMAARQQIHQW